MSCVFPLTNLKYFPDILPLLQVLQRSMDMELELTGVGGKVGAAAGQPVAKLTITGLASTPVDHDTKNNNTLLITGTKTHRLHTEKFFYCANELAYRRRC